MARSWNDGQWAIGDSQDGEARSKGEGCDAWIGEIGARTVTRDGPGSLSLRGGRWWHWRRRSSPHVREGNGDSYHHLALGRDP